MPPRAPDPARHRVAPGEPAGLADRDTAESGRLRRGPTAEAELARQRARIATLQPRLCHAHTPARGMIAVFNRSHYEDVLVVRVRGLVPKRVWRAL